jgi:hypothetical protein
MIASCLFLQQNLSERYQRAFILMEPNKHIFVHSQYRSKTFLGERHLFAPTPNVGVVHIFGGMYMILILKA